MTEIVPGLWIGGLPAIEETREMDLIVNLEGGKVYPDRPTFLWVIGDGPALPDVRTLDLVVGMIDAALTAGQRVLVHCTAGLNRSGLVVGRVLIRRRLNGREAVALLRARHDPQALNNATFAHYLETFG